VKLPKNILAEIKRRVHEAEPGASVILYGSYARGDADKESDIDLLVIVDKAFMNYDDKVRITKPLYKLEIETGRIISPLVKTKKEWNNYYYTPLYYNVKKEGFEL